MLRRRRRRRRRVIVEIWKKSGMRNSEDFERVVCGVSLSFDFINRIMIDNTNSEM